MSTRGGGDLPKETQKAFIRRYLQNSEFEAKSGQDIDRVIDQIDLEAEIDSTLPVNANWEAIKDRHGLVTLGELDELLASYEEQDRRRVRQEVRSQLEEYGIEQVTDALAGNPAPEALEQRVNDVLSEFPPDVYDAEIRDRVLDILNILDEDFSLIERERLSELREEAQRPGSIQDARREVLVRLGGAFGQQFESVEEAVRALQERIAQARGERLRIAPIQARRSGDDVLVRIEDGEQFSEFSSLVSRRVRRAIAFPADGPRTWVEVGEIRLRGGELERISLAAGAERYGTTEEAEDIPVVEEVETEQTGLPAAEEQPGDGMVQRALRLLEGS